MSRSTSAASVSRYSHEASRSACESCIHSNLNAVGRQSRSFSPSIHCVWLGAGILPKLTSVTLWPTRSSPATSSRVYVQTPPIVSAVTKMCMFQFFEWDWFLFLDIAVTFLLERRGVIGVGPLPGILVRRIAKRLLVQRTTGIRKHGHGFAYPNTPGPEMLLPGANLPAIVMFGKNQVGLHPGYPAAGIDQQLSDPVGIQTAVFVQLVAAFVSNGLNAARHGATVGASQQIERLLIPQVT